MKQKNKGKQQKGKAVVRKDFKIKDVNSSLVGKKGSITGVISSIAQTSGPTLFSVNDGTGTLVLKGFESPGARAYPNLKEDDVVKALIKINEYQGEFEGEIFSIRPLLANEAKKAKDEIKDRIRKKAKPNNVDFLVKSEILDKLKPGFIKAATEIRLAIMQDRPIIVRHHNDADGYSSGYALERAIIPLIEQQHGFGKSAWEFFMRAPCQAPFYEIDDSIRDTANSLRNAAKFSNKMPLVIIADNGSSDQDLFAIQQGKVHGMDFIVIDHHFFEEDVISKEVLVHINPFLVGEDGSHYSAGMLCTELARFISDVEEIEPIAAMAGLADRIANPDAMGQYLKIAEKQGYSKELLGDIADVIDFVSAKLRFMEAREYIEVVFGHPRKKQQELVSIMAPYIRNLEKKGLEMAKSAAKIEKVGKVNLQCIDVHAAFPGFGFYPKPGKCIGLVHDELQKKKGMDAVVTAGIMDTAITLRATDEANFSVHELIALIEKKLPEAFVEGGGHKNAGSINFISRQKEAVVKLLKEFVKKR